MTHLRSLACLAVLNFGAISPAGWSGDDSPAVPPKPMVPVPRSDPAAADLARLQGVWSVIRCEIAGQSIPLESDPRLPDESDLIFVGEKWLMHVPGQAMEAFALVKLQPATDPKQIDLTPTDGTSVVTAIYKFEGDELGRVDEL